MRQCDNPQCRKAYEPRRSWQRFCSTKCRVAGYWQKQASPLTEADVRRIATQVVREELKIKAIKESSEE